MKKVKNIVILGGGSSGWMTAALLSRRLPRDNFNFILVESKNIPSIGVGEATILTFERFMTYCGYEESDWFNYVEGTYKSGIVYTDWNKKGNKYWHPFGLMPRFDNNKYNLFDVINSTTDKLPDNIIELFHNYKLCVTENKPSESRAYHVNATLLANFFRTTLDVKHIVADITDINYNNMDVSSIVLDDNSVIEGDLFVDCLGFNSIIKKKNSSYIFKDKSDSTPCNAAIAAAVRYTNPDIQKHPYTLAHCTPYGWMWSIPISTRIGTGMVYNRDLCNVDDVEKYFVEYWGKENFIVDKFNHIKFTPGYYTNPWLGNVASIGLSSGFVEPLESSGLAFIIDGAVGLLGRIRKGFYTSNDVQEYNATISLKYEETFDFISMHYLNSEREEPFWQHVRNNHRMSDTLSYRLDYIKNNRFEDYNLDDGTIFGTFSWLYLAYQFANVAPGHFKIDSEKANILLREYKGLNNL